MRLSIDSPIASDSLPAGSSDTLRGREALVAAAGVAAAVALEREADAAHQDQLARVVRELADRALGVRRHRLGGQRPGSLGQNISGSSPACCATPLAWRMKIAKGGTSPVPACGAARRERLQETGAPP